MEDELENKKIFILYETECDVPVGYYSTRENAEKAIQIMNKDTEWSESDYNIIWDFLDFDLEDSDRHGGN